MRWALLLAVLALGCDGPKAPSSPPSTELNALFARASQLAARDPKTALELFRKVVSEAGPEDPLRAQAMARVAQLTAGPDTTGAEGHGGVAIAAPAIAAPPSSDAARDLYLRGYQLRTSDRQGAIDAFQRVVAMTPPADELHEKAKRRLDELSPVSELEDAYQRAYVIREHDRATALQLFRRVAAEAPPGSALQQRAAAEAQRLTP